MNLSRISKYFSPVRYWCKLLFWINKGVLQNIDIAMAPSYDTEFKYPPIFFLGAPRSGSTLIYQAVTDSFDVAYQSNCHCQFFGAPALAERIFRPLKKKVPSDFTSNHGEAIGWSAPAECGQWWYRFFRRTPAYVTLKDVEEKKMQNFRRSILALTKAADKPVVFKNLYASLRLEAIAKHVPEALFIIVHRDELDNAHSLLEARYKVFGSYNEWFSMPSENVESLKKRPAEVQVVEQIRGIHYTIQTKLNLSNVIESRIHHINYEQFCSDAHNELTELGCFFKKNAFVRALDLSNVPQTFERKNAVRIDGDLYARVKEYVN